MRRWALLAAALGALGATGCGGKPAPGHPAVEYTRLPMAFERNDGQAPAGVRFVARGAGYALLLTDRAPVLRLARAGGRPRDLRLGLAGTEPGMRLASAGPRVGTVNYLVGRRSAWHAAIPSYGAARYANAYPGIAVAFHGTNRSLEFDFELAPGADPRRIALAPSGQRSLRIDRGGALVLALPGGTVREQPPVSRQVLAGRTRRVASRFVRHPDGTIGIRVGRYDRRRPLTIDPVLTYGTYLGGTSFDLGNGIATDAAGAAYVTGTTASVDFPVTSGAQQTAFAGNQDAFVTKIAPDGRSRVYSTYLGGAGIDIANDIAVDASGAAYLTGSTTSADMPTTPGAFQAAYAGGTSDAFAAKLAPTGAALTWSTYLGGAGSDQGMGIAVASGGAPVISGVTGSVDFPTTPGAAQTAYGGGGSDAFVTKLAPTAAALSWSTYLGGSAADAGGHVALDSAGAAYVTGRTQSAGFPTSAGAPQTTLRGSADAFVTEVSAAGDAFAYSTLLGGSGAEAGEGIAVDDGGAAYVTGNTTSVDFPATAGAAQTAYGGGTNDAFAAKVAPGGGSLAYATLLGGGGADLGHAIAVDAAHEAFVTGQTASTDFPFSADAVQTAYPGGPNAAFVTRLSASGARTFSSYLGGSSGAAAQGIAMDGAGAAYVTGATNSTDLPVTAGAAQPANGGSTDAFVAKLVVGPPAATTTTTTPPATTTTVAPPPPTDTTPTTVPAGPKIVTGPVRTTWNTVSVSYRLLRGAAILFDVVTPAGREITADLASGSRQGTLHWNRRVGGRVAPPGRYHLILTASAPNGGVTTKHLGVTLRVLYAHAPRIRAGAARIAYELTEPAVVTLAVGRGGGPRTVVVRQRGRRGPNALAWNLMLGGRRVAGGAYRLYVTARTRKGTIASVAVPAR